MLQSIRDNLQGKMAKVIIAIIIVPFAIFGVESLIGMGGGDVAAEVNGEEIHPNELAQAVNTQQRRLLSQMGDDVDPSQLDESRLRGPVLDLLIDQRLLMQEAQALGMAVPDVLVDRVIVAAPEFREEGRFSPERYRAILANQGFTPAWFKNQVVRKEMLISQLQRGLLLSDFATDADLALIAALAWQQRSYEWVQVPADEPAPETIDAERIARFYEVNAARFTQPERVRLAYVELKAEDFAPAVDEAALRAEYERETAEGGTTQREVAHILIGTPGDEGRERAAALRQTIADGADFAEVAREQSDDPGSRSEGGYLGATAGSTFPEAFEAAVSQLAVGDVSQPVATEAGWHLIKVLSAQQSQVATFEERRAELEQRLASAQAQPELLKAVEQMRDLAFNAGDLRGPAAAVNATVRESDWLTREGAQGLLGNARVVNAAFSPDVLEEGHNSDAIELAPDHYVFVRVAAREKAHPLPLDTVRDEIALQLAQEDALAATRARARELLARLEGGDDLAPIAEAAGLRHGREESVTRSGQPPLPGLTQAVFALGKPVDGAVHDVVELEDRSVAVVALHKVEAGDPTALSQAEQQGWRAQLATGEGQAMFAALLDQLRNTADIERF